MSEGHKASSAKPQGIRVAWRGQVQLPLGGVVEVKVVELSASTVDLMCPQPVTAGTQLALALLMPPLNPGEKPEIASGNCKVLFQVLKHGEFHLHLQWVNLPTSLKTRLTTRTERAR